MSTQSPYQLALAAGSLFNLLLYQIFFLPTALGDLQQQDSGLKCAVISLQH